MFDELFGDDETPEAAPVVEAPVVLAPPVVLPPAAPKVAGIATRTVVKARVLDLALVVKAAAAGNTDAMVLLSIDQSALTMLTRRHGMGLSVPGIETYEDAVVSARAG